MAVPPQAAPPTPWSSNLAEPNIDQSAYVHSFSNLIGDVIVGANVLISPGTSIRADEGFPFYIGRASNIQDGVVIHGLEQGKFKGDDGRDYSVWIGEETCITHMALIHGPAYVGNHCFIGFRSTVFNSKIGDGCIVMMHALIQDVEIPPGKYVPSGAIITNQQQADRLPDVQEGDRAFAHHVVEINEALLAGYHCAENHACINPIKDSLQEDSHSSYPETPMSLDSSIREQVRALVSQGYKISTEHANPRRFKTKSWLNNPIIDSQNEQQVLGVLDQVLQSHPGEYIRLIGIDTAQKKRVAEVIIQRPDGSTPNISPHRHSAPSNGAGAVNGHGAGGDVATEVRNAINQGYKLTVERASKRRFKTNSWLTIGAIEARNAQQAVSQINGLIAEHGNEYIRLISINTQSKTRASQTIVHRPGGVNAPSSGASNGASASAGNFSSVGSSSLDPTTVQKVQSLLSQGYRIGTEHADVRRFKTKSWKSCSPIQSTNPPEVIRALEGCIQDHHGEYVRMIGIDPKAKTRVYEAIIQRPGKQSSVNNRATVAAPSNGFGSNSSGGYGSNAAASSLGTDVQDQISGLLRQGFKIGIEYANKRRFKTKSWQTESAINSSNQAEVIQALERCLNDHTGEYVRLVGIDPQARKRVLETIIQRP